MAGVVSGEGWIKKRVTFLRERLADPLVSDDERAAIETELEALSKESGIMPGGVRFPRLLRRLRRR